MEEYAAGTDVTLTILHMSNGTSLTVTNLQFQVLDSSGAELQAMHTAPGFDGSLSSTDITILATYNSNSSVKIDVRQVNVLLVTAGGTFKQTIYYKTIGDITNLTPMVDSFMTFAESIIYRVKSSENLKYFDMLPDELKSIALTNAFESLVKLKFSFDTGTHCPTPTDISTMDLTAFQALPAGFQDAIKRAQLAEANMVVENSPVREKIREGIISETIGESSMFFKQGTFGVPSKFPGLSDEAYSYIKDWLYRNATSAQIWRIARA